MVQALYQLEFGENLVTSDLTTDTALAHERACLATGGSL